MKIRWLIYHCQKKNPRKVVYLEDKSGQLVPHVQLETMSTSLAAGNQDSLLVVRLDHGLRILAVLAQDELLDEAVEHVLQLGGVVRAVHDVAVVLEVELGLGPELAPEKLGWI